MERRPGYDGAKVRGTWTALAGVLALGTGWGEEPTVWIRAATPHFEIYTTESEARAREAVLYLEQVRAFFEHARPAMRLPVQPVRIVAFRSEEEYRPFRTLEQSAAHYQTGLARESIVMPGLTREQYGAAVHEFVHLLAHNSGVNAPPWLDEGLAEIYSTLRPVPRHGVSLGEAPPAHLRLLAEGKWLDLSTLVGAAKSSEQFSDPKLVHLFYAESWALVHMLALSEEYGPRFDVLVDRIATGEDSQAAIEDVYQKPITRVQGDLANHLRHVRSMPPSRLVLLDMPAAQPEIGAAPPLAWKMVLADLVSGLPGRLAEGKQAYEELAREYPRSCEPAAALVRLAMGSGTVEEARQQLSRAIRSGCSDPEFLLEYARLGPAAGEEISKAGLLRKALELRPGDVGIEVLLAMTLYDSGDYAAAREWMLRIPNAPPGREAEFFRALAYSNDRLGRPEEARSAAKRAVEAAQTPEEAGAGLGLLEFLNRPAAAVPQMTAGTSPAPEQPPEEQPPARASVPAPVPRSTARLYRLEGELVQYDCLGGTARIWVQSGREKLALRIPAGDKLIIRQGGEQVLRFLLCGPQKRERIRVGYEMVRDAWLGTVGDVRVMEFQ